MCLPSRCCSQWPRSSAVSMPLSPGTVALMQLRSDRETRWVQSCASHFHGYKGTGGFGGRGCGACVRLVESLRSSLWRGVRYREDPGPGGEQGARERLSGSAADRSCEADGRRTSELDVPLERRRSSRFMRFMYFMYSRFSSDGHMQCVSYGKECSGCTCRADEKAAGDEKRE